MNILSINFGHDASLVLMRDGEVVSFSELERHYRIKHVMGVDAQDIRRFLDGCGLSFPDVDVVSMCGTQLWGGAYQGFSIEPGLSKTPPSFISPHPSWAMNTNFYSVDSPGGHYQQQLERFDDLKWVKFPDVIGLKNIHCDGIPNDNLGQKNLTDVCSIWLNETEKPGDSFRFNRVGAYFHPYQLTLDGVCKPAFFVPHHYSHAWYASYYASDKGIICSHDGGVPTFPFNSGGIYLLNEHEVMPVCSHNLGLGHLYDNASALAGFSVGDGAGKLMGLAAYGIPSGGVANLVARQLARLDSTVRESSESLMRVLKELVFLAQNETMLRGQGISEFDFELPNRDFSIALAANTQSFAERVFSESMSRAINILRDKLDVGSEVSLVGGFTLNCPANAQLQTVCGGMHIRPLPGAIDAGIALGAACAVHYFFHGKRPRETDHKAVSAAFPKRMNRASGWQPSLQEIHQWDAEWMAEELVAGKIFCVFQGDSEIGPRALGHRSIVAHAVSKQTRNLINSRKGRESWRPLAPMCRTQDFHKFFYGSPQLAEYMLFTFPVLDKNIPAVTHVDGTARVQVVHEEAGGILFDVLGCLDDMGAIPVIVNTSFNVAGEPIVETEAEAERSFKKLGFDYLYVNGKFFALPGTGMASR